MRYFSRAMLKAGTPSIWVYLFAHPTQSALTGIPGEGPGSVVVSHASEIAYVFARVDALDAGEETDLALPMSSYWSNFATWGDPNGDGGLTQRWPSYNADEDAILRIDVKSKGGIRVQRELRKAACDWQRAHPRISPTSLPVV